MKDIVLYEASNALGVLGSYKTCFTFERIKEQHKYNVCNKSSLTGIEGKFIVFRKDSFRSHKICNCNIIFLKHIKTFPLVSVSRPALWPTLPSMQWVSGVISPGIKRGRSVTLTTHPFLVPR
jgi:hypothetical protein